MEAKEEIRSRLNIEDVIGEYVQLKRAGKNYKGLSPFSNEKTPSFMVSPDKHIWHDFSSNKGGDIFSFIMEAEGVDFRAALELLARRAGVDLSQYEQKGDGGLKQRKERLYGVLELATRFYQRSLINNSVAIEYVSKRRQFTKQVVAQFRLGYAPNAEDGLTRVLLKRGYKENDLRDAGLAVLRRGRLGDMFRGRLIVPLADGQGRVVGFTARLIEDQPDAPKYINTPQTLLYDKGRQVFGLHLAKEAIRKSDRVVIVEGNLDVIASHQAGVHEVVATAGTAMTEYHLKDLSRLTSNILLAFDRDRAGVLATERAIGIAGKIGVQLRIVTVPAQFKDPDELIKVQPEGWPRVIDRAADAIEWLIDVYAERYDLSTAEGKRRTTTKALELLSALTDPVEQEHYMKLLAGRTNTSFESIRQKFDQGLTGSAPTLPRRTVHALKPDQAMASKSELLYQDYLLAMMLVYPELRSFTTELVSAAFSGSIRQAVFEIIQRLGQKPFENNLLAKLRPDELCVKIKELQLIAEQRFAQYQGSLHAEAYKYSKQLQIDYKNKQKVELARSLAEESDPGRRQEKNNAYMQLLKEIEALKQARRSV